MFRTVQNSSEQFTALQISSDLVMANFTVADMMEIGKTAAELKDAGFKAMELVVVWTVDRKKLELQQNVKYMEFAAYDLKTDREFMLLGRNGRVR